jgi:hypothetical protein
MGVFLSEMAFRRHQFNALGVHDESVRDDVIRAFRRTKPDVVVLTMAMHGCG